jgi:cell division protein FtsI/penicillin-binding protein 2
MIAGAMLLAALLVLEARLASLQIQRHDELSAKAAGYTRQERRLEPWRGEIHDRAGHVLAVNTPTRTLYADLTVCTNRPVEVIHVLAPLLRTNESYLWRRLRPDAVPPRFRSAPGGGAPGTNRRAPKWSPARKAVELKRDVPPWEWERIRTNLALATFGLDPRSRRSADRALLGRLRRRAVFADEGQARVYPYGESLAQVLGFVGPAKGTGEMEGKAGIERSCNTLLAGVGGVLASEQDAAGRELPLRRQRLKEPVDGARVVLTIDLGLQRIVERALAEAMAKRQPRHASALILDVRTGDILAMASLPAFSPRHPGAADPATWRNPVISDRVEPGSTFKIVTFAAALEVAGLTPDQPILCGNERLGPEGLALRDHVGRGFRTAREALVKSSNTGLAELGLKTGGPALHTYMTNFGFGRPTGIALPGESPGYVPAAGSFDRYAITRLAIGQGVAVTQLQMALGMAAIANDGLLMSPRLVDRLESPTGVVVQRYAAQRPRRVISAATAAQMRETLCGVVSRAGTAPLAAPALYHAFGKTGTAQKADSRGYLKGRYYSSFVGCFPADRPVLCISVALDEPQNAYYGGTVAAPVFKAIADEAGAYLRIPPGRVQRPKPGDSVGPRVLLASGSVSGRPGIARVPAPAGGTNRALLARQ